MSKLVKLSLVLSVFLVFTSCSETTAQSKEVTQEATALGKMQMNIQGMTCAMGCARAIEVELKNIEGVSDALVDFSSATASVSFDSAATSEASLVDFVNTYRNGAFRASLASVKSCCAPKSDKSCTPEQKANCETSGAKSTSKATSKSCGAN